jgi:hypothetical protein
MTIFHKKNLYVLCLKRQNFSSDDAEKSDINCHRQIVIENTLFSDFEFAPHDG